MLWPIERGRGGLRGAESSRGIEKGRESQSDRDRECQRRAERVRQEQMWAVSDRVGKGQQGTERCTSLSPALLSYFPTLSDTAHIFPYLTLSVLFCASLPLSD